MLWPEPTSALQRSIHGPGYALWSTDTELLATIRDEISFGNIQRSGKKKKVKPIPRPKDKAAKRLTIGTPVDLDELDARLGWESPRNRK